MPFCKGFHTLYMGRGVIRVAERAEIISMLDKGKAAALDLYYIWAGRAF